MMKKISTIAGCLLIAWDLSVADHVCHLMIDGCPEWFNGISISVPLEAVALHGEANFCPPDISMQGMARVEASIIFVIDDSGSMYTLPGGTPGSGNDPNGERYKVTVKILDQIYAISPKTRVGVVAFRNWLAWDWRDDPMFRKITNFPWNDSYFPLTPLDSTLANGKTGIETIKSLITQLDQWNLLQAFHVNDSTERTRPLCSGGVQCTKNQQGTDITLAFLAAKDAMSYSPTPKERQFVVFLSDGLPGAVDVEMEARKFEFINGEGMPTTFTIFLGAGLQTPPDQLLQMTQNIRNNRYSSANPRSELWTVATTHDTLMALMQRAILTEIFRSTVTPVHASISVGSSISSSLGWTDSSFLFPTPIPLQSQTTPVNMQLVFSYDDSNGVRRDTTLRSQFTIVRSTQASWSALPAGMSKICFERNISLSSNNRLITSVITNSQTSLTLSLMLEGIPPSSTQTVFITTPSGGDTVSLALTYVNGFFTGTFNRETGNAIAGDNILQHRLMDTAVIIWRNPDNALDVLTKLYPISAYDPVSITSVAYLDLDADGFIDAIRIETSPAFNPSEITALTADRFVFPAQRMLTFTGVSIHPDTLGFDILVRQNESTGKNTAVDPSKDSLKITQYAIGPYDNYIPQGTYPILDQMAPVVVSVTYKPQSPGSSQAATLEVVFSEEVPKINASIPFYFTDSTGKTYTMTLSSLSAGGKEHVFSVLSINPSTQTPQIGDLVYINPGANIMDTKSNVQDKPGEGVQLKIEYPPYSFQVYAGPNPFIAGQTIPMWDRVPGMTSGYGTVIVVQSNVPSSGQIPLNIKKIAVNVYDCVANLVASWEIKDIAKIQTGSNFNIHWDGRNRNNRFVSGGTYVAVISITASDNNGKTKTSTHSLKIGVKM